MIFPRYVNRLDTGTIAGIVYPDARHPCDGDAGDDVQRSGARARRVGDDQSRGK